MIVSRNKMGIVGARILHLLRAAALLFWLFLGRTAVPRMPPLVASALALGVVYGLVLVALPRISLAMRRRIAIGILIIPAMLIHLEREPWNWFLGHWGLYLYLPEVMVGLKWKRGLAVLVSVLALSIMLTFLALFRIGWARTYDNASLNGRPVSCAVIKLPTLPGVIVYSKDMGWARADAYRSSLEQPYDGNRSFLLGHAAFVDIRALRHANIVTEDDPFKTGWDPRVRYKNRELSFYPDPNRRFVCKGVDL